ncbi:MAG: ATP-dependent DNA helicase RecQ [Oscillospiraceae bacterium]|jgi:RecQ family ATP-dependent DNA helicase|nr:ATP-dependent DNA helicase RecQ [Oscillospiraceae bacterium]
MDIKRSIKQAQNQLGIDKLRKHQVDPINSILDGNDTMVIAPTSAGKSVIYQIPALLFSGMTLVIEPTLSLLYDQVNKLQSIGIKAASIDSAMPAYERSRILERTAKGKIKLLFVTPERLQKEKFLTAIMSSTISLVVVDECHCVTSWGYGFRSDYLKIGEFIDSLTNRPIVAALTATAAPEERKGICKLLSMQNSNVFVQSLRRKNLHFLKRSFVSDEEKLYDLKSLLKKHKSGSCIVYCNTKKMTDAVYDEVREWYPDDVAKCHSNLGGQSRKANEQQFLSGEKHIMVATSAFGMGIDKEDVDLVIHFNIPLSLVDYYQQAGRAGRAGQSAKCVLLYCEDDYFVNRMICKEISNKSACKVALAALDAMKEYAESDACLTRQLLSALGEETTKRCGSCTNCQKARKRK